MAVQQEQLYQNVQEDTEGHGEEGMPGFQYSF